MLKAEWLFFDMGHTLIDEGAVWEERFRGLSARLGMGTVWVRQGFGLYQTAPSPEYEPDDTVENLAEAAGFFL